MHCQPRARKPSDQQNPVLRLRDREVKEVSSYKYLGAHVDSQIWWKAQGNEAMVKAMSYILMFHRLMCTSLGSVRKSGSVWQEGVKGGHNSAFMLEEVIDFELQHISFDWEVKTDFTHHNIEPVIYLSIWNYVASMFLDHGAQLVLEAHNGVQEGCGFEGGKSHH